MLGLQELQAVFYRHVVADDPDIGQHIVSTVDLAGDERLAIYSNAYRARLVEALAVDYPALQAVLGEAAFTELSHAYTAAYPSRYFSLRWFGQHLATFMKTDTAYRDRPYLTELAAFEWSFVDAFDAADVTPAGEAEAAQVPPEAWPAMTFAFHPSMRWLACDWDAVAQWRAYKDKGPMPAAARLDKPVTVLFWRHALVTHYRILDDDEAVILHRAAGGANFAALCESLVDWHEPGQVAMRSASLLKTWLAEGLICRLVAGA